MPDYANGPQARNELLGQYEVVHQRNVLSESELDLGRRARAVERERCAQIAERGGSPDEIADNIRRGKSLDDIRKV